MITKYINGHGLAKLLQELSSRINGYLSTLAGRLTTIRDNNYNCINIQYDNLVAMRNNMSLVTGQQYRITDYETTTSQEGTKTANHRFDIIVTATSRNTLSEEAIAVVLNNTTDTYFISSAEGKSNLNAWKIWYCLDNDTDRFLWAGANADFPAIDVSFTRNSQFKGIFERKKNADKVAILGDNKEKKMYAWNTIDDSGFRGPDGFSRYDTFYTESEELTDGYYSLYVTQSSNDGTIWYEFEIAQITNTTYNKKIGKGVIYRMIDEFGNDCPYDFKNIMFELDGKYYYTFSWVSSNGSITDSSIVGNNGYVKNDENIIPGVQSNIIGKYSDNGISTLPKNIFFSNYEFDNGIFYGCNNNILGNNCYNNVFDNGCNNNILGNNCYSNNLSCWFTDNKLDNGCNNIKIINNDKDLIKNHKFVGPITGEFTLETNTDHQVTVAYNSNHDIKIYCEADLIF